MKILSSKLFTWLCFLTFIGGTALFVFLVLEKGLPQGKEVWINLWPAVTTLGTVVSFVRLRGAYRAEPGDGFWQFSMSDLLLATLTFGAALGLSRLAGDELLFGQSMLIAALLAGIMLFGPLIAAHLGVPADRRRIYGLGFSFATLGVLIAGGLLCLLAVSLLYTGRLDLSVVSRSPLIHAALLTLLCCIPGSVVCFYIARIPSGLSKPPLRKQAGHDVLP